MMLLIEFCLTLCAVLAGFIFPAAGSRWFETIEGRFAALAQHRFVSVVIVGLLALTLRAALLPVLPVPEPVVHDEFGYLLAADTFAHGRLTNPTHPMWQHFETFSVIHKPTYQCFAQPAQGLILAFGKVLFGHPFWGVWLNAGAMCAAICWMLQGWLSPGWALLGGFLAVLRFGTFAYWANSYWGGAAGAIGGALVLGALPRIKRSQRVRDALLMGMGLAILANSRPYEGFVFSLPVAVALFAWLLGKESPALQVTLRRVVAPLCLFLALAAIAMGYYFWRVTGSPFRMPYQVERETYAAAPLLLWQGPKQQPSYRHEVLYRIYVNGELTRFRVARTLGGFAFLTVQKIYEMWSFYLGPALTVPALIAILTLPYGFSWRDFQKRTRFLLLAFFVSLAGLAAELYYEPHYLSPCAALIVALLLVAIHHLHGWQWRGKPTGLFVTRAVPVICVVMFVLRAAAAPLHLQLSEFYSPAWHQSGSQSFGRTAINRDLDRLPGRQLVVVHYRPEHDLFQEWVYNDADIDNSKVVWAHDMSPAENEELIKYFRDRRVWLLEADEHPPKLTQYQLPGNVNSGEMDKSEH